MPNTPENRIRTGILIQINPELDLSGDRGKTDIFFENISAELSEGRVVPVTRLVERGGRVVFEAGVVGVENDANGEPVETKIFTAPIYKARDISDVVSGIRTMFLEEQQCGAHEVCGMLMDSIENDLLTDQYTNLVRSGLIASTALARRETQPLSRPQSPPVIEIPTDMGGGDTRLFDFLFRALTDSGIMAQIFLDPEVRNSIVSMAREKVEALGIDFAKQNSKRRQRAFSADFANFRDTLKMTMGISDVREYLRDQFEKRKKHGDVSGDLEFDSLDGFMWALGNIVYPMIEEAHTQAALSGERVDKSIVLAAIDSDAEVQRKQVELDSIIEETKRDLAVIRAEHRGDIEAAEILAKQKREEQLALSAPVFARSKKAQAQVTEAILEGLGDGISSLLRGLAKAPVAVIRGTTEAIQSFVTQKPATAIGSIAALAILLEAGATGATAPVFPAVACLGGGLLVQATWEKILAPTMIPWLQRHGVKIGETRRDDVEED